MSRLLYLSVATFDYKKLFLLYLIFMADKRAIHSAESDLFPFEIGSNSGNMGKIGSIVLEKGNTVISW